MSRPDPLSMLGLLAALAAALGWATSGVFVRLLPNISPTAILCGRYTVGLAAASAFLACRWLIVRRPAVRTPNGWRLWTIALLMALYFAAATPSFVLTSVAEATLIINSSSIFSLIWSVVRRERPALSRAGGAILALVGVAIILTGPAAANQTRDSTDRLLGDLLAAAAALAAAVYVETVAAWERRGWNIPAVPAATRALAWGALGMFPFAWLTAADDLAKLLTSGNVIPLLCLGILSTILPTVCYSFAACRLPPIVTTSFRLLTPPAAAVLAMLLLREQPPQTFLVGVVPVLVGLWLVARSSTPTPR